MKKELKEFLKQHGKELAVVEGEIVTLLSFKCTLQEIADYLHKIGVEATPRQISRYIKQRNLKAKAAHIAKREVHP